jgi:hypothetical protein
MSTLASVITQLLALRDSRQERRDALLRPGGSPVDQQFA